MELRLLGTLELLIDGRLTKLGPQQQRCILAALAHDAGSRVSIEKIVDRVWGESPPATCRETTHKYVSGLRRIVLLGGGSANIISGGRQGGYLLDIPRESVDLHQFQRLLAAARAADNSGQYDAVVRFTEEALGLWQGDAALPTLTGEWAERIRNQLDQDRFGATKVHIGARLQLGQHNELVGVLTRMVGQYPYDETLVEHLMTALYRSGQRTAALEQFTTAYRRLYHEQGMEIGRRLSEIQQRILRDDPSLLLGERIRSGAATRGREGGLGLDSPAGGDRPDPGRHRDTGPTGAGVGDYSAAERQDLVVAVLGSGMVRDRSARDNLVTDLEAELGHPLEFTRHPVDRVDVARLVDSCLSRPGALSLLASVIARWARDAGPDPAPGDRAAAAETVAALVRRLAPVALLEPAERRELLELVREVHCGGVATLYRTAVGPAGRPLARDPADLVGIVHDLEESTALPGGMPPLLVFVGHLAGRVPEATGSKLRGWVDRTAERLDLPASAVTRARAGDPDGPDLSRAYLVVQLQPDGVDTERYLLSIWLQYDGQIGDTVRRDDEPYSLTEIQAALDEVLTEAPMVTGGEFSELVVEFVLPRSLLNHEVDQWTIGTSMRFPRRMGIWYPVVLRSLERMRSRAMHRYWRQKWNWLQANRDAPDGQAVFWIRAAGELHPEALLSKLILDPGRVCLVLPFPPPPYHELGPDELGQDELATGLHAGTPIVVWCRDRTDPGRFTGQLRALLEDGPLVELPGRALTLRQQAVARQGGSSDDHLGLHLSVLWDDADRLPEPYVPLRAPTWRAPV